MKQQITYQILDGMIEDLESRGSTSIKEEKYLAAMKIASEYLKRIDNGNKPYAEPRKKRVEFTCITVSNLGFCPKCSCTNLFVSSRRDISPSRMYAGDSAQCINCGHSGRLAVDGYAGRVVWDEE